jgi:hypothetical protein
MALNRLVQHQAPDPAVLADASDGLRRLSKRVARQVEHAASSSCSPMRRYSLG